MKRLFYALTDVAGYKKDQAVLFDQDDEAHGGLIRTGYFEEIRNEEARRGAEEPDRAE